MHLALQVLNDSLVAGSAGYFGGYIQKEPPDVRGNPTEGGGAGMNHVLLYLYTNFVQVQAARLLKLAISLCFRCIGLPRGERGGGGGRCDKSN